MSSSNSTISALWLSVAIIMLCTQSDAGLATTTGKEWHLWSEGKYSVIVAHVAEVREPAADAADVGLYFATFEPLVTLAGALDPSEHPKLAISLHAGGYGTSIEKPPTKGTTVLAVLQGDDFVVSDICRFMPNGASLAEISGLGDPRVIETLKKLQEARAHANPDPYVVPPPQQSSTTKPK